MTPNELRSRIARSRVSGHRLARALGIAQPQVAKWCMGIRPIPEPHVPKIRRITDSPPPRTELAWRPPADMPPSRSKGATHRVARSRVSRQRRAARAERPEATHASLPSRRSVRPRQPAPPRRTAADRPAPVMQTLDLSVLNNLLKVITPIDGNRVDGARTVPAMAGPVAGPSQGQRPAPAPQPTAAPPQTAMAGPNHADFVAQGRAVLATISIPLSGLLRPKTSQ